KRIKRAVPLIPPREGAAFWEQGHPRNLAVGCQKLYGSNKKWKKQYGYHKRSLSETAMYWVKQLLVGKLSLRNYNAQVGETYVRLKCCTRLQGLVCLKLSVLFKYQSIWGSHVFSLN
ncbi:hypothetical protein QNE88_004727, partial [Vibrio alginolyticus]|nr:hypothetical protein [Vibrio alginolyticus]